MEFLTSSSIHHWLNIRVRLIAGSLIVAGSLLPPYVPKAALAPAEASIETSQFLFVEDGFLMKSSSLTRQGSRRAYAEGIVHTVKEGESLERLANRYGIAVDTIRWANSLTQGTAIRPGQELLILPVDGVLHTVARGQTLTRIAELYGIAQDEIMRQNKLESTFILAGQQLIVPSAKPIVGKPQVATAERPPAPAPPVKELGKTPPPPALQAEVAFTPSPTLGVLQKPCDAGCFYTQYFHAGHFGVDLQTHGGGPVYAAEDGVVIRSDYGWNGGYGNVVEIDHGNGLVTLYGHNKEIYVSSGDLVKRGQTISWMGNSGLVYGSTGIHVHFEVQLNGVKKNPLLYLE